MGTRVGGFHCISATTYLLCAATNLARPSPSSDSQAIAHSPGVCHWTVHRAPLLRLDTGCPTLSRSQTGAGSQSDTYTFLSVLPPRQPAGLNPWKWNNDGLRQNWGWERGSGGQGGREAEPSDQVFQTWLHHLPFLGFDKLAYLPKPQLPHKENGNRSTYLEDWFLRISSNSCETPDV